MQEANYTKSTWIKNSIFSLVTFFVFGFTLFIGLAWGGFSENFVSGKALDFGSNLTSLMIYLIFGFVTLGNGIFAILKNLDLKPSQHPSTAPNPRIRRIFEINWIHAPEENGLLYFLSSKLFGWTKNPLKVFWYSFLIFSAFGILVLFFPNFTIADTPQLGFQQVTPLSEIGFKALVPAWVENGVLLLFFSLFSGIGAFIIAKTTKKKGLWFGWNFFMCVLMGLLWMGFHSIVYSNSESSLVITFLFGFVGTFLTMLFGSLIPFFLLHFINNTSLVLTDLVTRSEDLKFIVIISWVILTGITIFISRQRKKNKKSIDGIPN